jgi:hypothetical protein
MKVPVNPGLTVFTTTMPQDTHHKVVDKQEEVIHNRVVSKVTQTILSQILVAVDFRVILVSPQDIPVPREDILPRQDFTAGGSVEKQQISIL